MTESEIPRHTDLELVLTNLELGVAASDLHGSLTGFLCGGGVASARNWLERLEIDIGEPSGLLQHQDLLDALYRGCRSQLDDVGLSFLPLLPDDAQPLTDRGDALVEWCRGFLGGLGLSGINTQRGLSEDAAEILRDFGTIAASHFDYQDSEEDEAAFMEVLEFVRVGVLLLHAELAAAAAPEHGRVH